MPITWTDFEECIKERVAFYRQQYDQATRIYGRLLKDNGSTAEQLRHTLLMRQAMADELTRLDGLLNKYATVPKTAIGDRKIIRIGTVRLN